MKFNELDLSGYFDVNEISGRGLAENEVSTIRTPGMSGAFYSSKRRPARRLEVSITIKATDPSDLRLKIDELNTLLDVDEPVPITFDDEPNRIYYGVPEEVSEHGEFVNFHQSTITFVCPDPYKYGPEVTADFPSDNVKLINRGSAETSPVFEMEVLAPITFAMIQNQNDQYQMIGTPAEDDVTVVATKVPILEERGETLDEWATTPAVVDTKFIDNVDGSMAYDGTGIFAESYGTGMKIHGPSIIREISPIQDFEIETTFDIISNFELDNYRMEVYFFDEQMQMLGKMGINDNNKNFIRRVGLARVGEYVDGDTRYLFGNSSYRYDNLGRVSLMYLRVKRIGNKYTFYISEIRNGRHYVTAERSYTDRSGKYTGRLKYVQLFIGNWADRPRTFRTRINYVNVYELVNIPEDRTPYIAYQGDKITFDHGTGELLINGEDRSDIKDFGGEYFKLATGENQLIVSPPDALRTKAIYRERFK